MIVFGGSSCSDLWTLSLAGVPEWQPLAAAGTPPSARSGHTAVYDRIRDRMLVFGGKDNLGPLNDVWELTLGGSPQWNLLAPSGSPPAARFHHAMVLDPDRDRLVIHGGQDDDFFTTVYDDVWELALTGSPAWSSITTAGSSPGITGHGGVYDPVDDRMVVVGLGNVAELRFWASRPGLRSRPPEHPCWCTTTTRPFLRRTPPSMVVSGARIDPIRREHRDVGARAVQLGVDSDGSVNPGAPADAHAGPRCGAESDGPLRRPGQRLQWAGGNPVEPGPRRLPRAGHPSHPRVRGLRTWSTRRSSPPRARA